MRPRLPRLLLVPLALAATLVAAPSVRAERLLGRAWETPIQEGVEKQEQERKARRADGLLRQAELLAARPSEGATKVARLYLLARAYGIAGDAASAESTYREVLDLAPDCYFAYHDLAMLALARTPPDPALAERYLRKAVQVHGGYVAGYRKLARLLLERGPDRLEEAVANLRRVVDLEPGDMEARFFLARALLGLGKLDEAERELAMLLRKEPRNPLYRDLKGAFYLRSGRIDRALETYQALAEELPDVVQPVRGYLACLTKLREKGQVDPEQWLWALERLYRLTDDPQEKQRLKNAIEEFRRLSSGEAPKPEEGGELSDEQLAALLGRMTDADQRAHVLGYVYARGKRPEKVLFDAVVVRLSPKTEPSAKVRAWVLRTVGRYGGTGMTGLVRLALADPDAHVRVAASDALVALSETSDAARGAAILVLGLYADASDAQLGAAARAAVRDLAKATLPEPGGDDEAARRAAYETWWRGPVAAEVKIRALHLFARVHDPFPEDILLPYAEDDDAFVADAAWSEMSAIAADLLARDAALRREKKPALLGDARRDWLRRMPPHVEGGLRGPDAAAQRARLAAWSAAKPG